MAASAPIPLGRLDVTPLPASDPRPYVRTQRRIGASESLPHTLVVPSGLTGELEPRVRRHSAIAGSLWEYPDSLASVSRDLEGQRHLQRGIVDHPCVPYTDPDGRPRASSAYPSVPASACCVLRRAAARQTVRRTPVDPRLPRGIELFPEASLRRPASPLGCLPSTDRCVEWSTNPFQQPTRLRGTPGHRPGLGASQSPKQNDTPTSGLRPRPRPLGSAGASMLRQLPKRRLSPDGTTRSSCTAR